jgi:HPr kinase/phosphorylase
MIAPSVTVADILNRRPDSGGLAMELLSGGAGLGRAILSPHIQKTGLALAGFHEYLQPSRILVFGESEVRYLESLDRHTRLEVIGAVFSHDIPCVLVTGGWDPPQEVLAASERCGVPLLRTAVATPLAIARLIVGESGIGKSECALDLIVRGHRLVADDTVEIRRRGEHALIGTCPELTRHHMELRGLGVINIRDLFGVASTRLSKRVELVVQLERWDQTREYDRLGIDETTYEMFGVRVPLIRMPVAPGRSLAILVEVAARNQLLRSRGLNAARDLARRLERELTERHDQETDPEDSDGHGEAM